MRERKGESGPVPVQLLACETRKLLRAVATAVWLTIPYDTPNASSQVVGNIKKNKKRNYTLEPRNTDS